MSRGSKKEIVQAAYDKWPAAALKLKEDIENKDWPGWKKQICITFLTSKMEASPTAVSLQDARKNPFEAWRKNARFQTLLKAQLEAAKNAFILCGITITICATLVFFFINAMIRQNYLVNFSVDAIVGVIAAVFLIRNLQIKYGLQKKYGVLKYGILMDLIAVLLSFLLKLWLPSGLDFTLFIFMISYFAQKRQFDTALDNIQKEI